MFIGRVITHRIIFGVLISHGPIINRAAKITRVQKFHHQKKKPPKALRHKSVLRVVTVLYQKNKIHAVHVVIFHMVTIARRLKLICGSIKCWILAVLRKNPITLFAVSVLVILVGVA